MSPRTAALSAILLSGFAAASHAQWPEPVDDSKVQVVRHVAPVLPTIAQRARLERAVVVGVAFDGRGAVTDAAVLSGNPLLTAPALQAARQWTFAPSPQGRAVLIFDFQLSDRCVDAEPPPPPVLRPPSRLVVHFCSTTIDVTGQGPR